MQTLSPKQKIAPRSMGYLESSDLQALSMKVFDVAPKCFPVLWKTRDERLEDFSSSWGLQASRNCHREARFALNNIGCRFAKHHLSPAHFPSVRQLAPMAEAPVRTFDSEGEESQ